MEHVELVAFVRWFMHLFVVLITKPMAAIVVFIAPQSRMISLIWLLLTMENVVRTPPLLLPLLETWKRTQVRNRMEYAAQRMNEKLACSNLHGIIDMKTKFCHFHCKNCIDNIKWRKYFNLHLSPMSSYLCFSVDFQNKGINRNRKKLNEIIKSEANIKKTRSYVHVVFTECIGFLCYRNGSRRCFLAKLA